MKKSCCIDDVNITPRNPSCSMVLRSDCSHGGSCKKSLAVSTKQGETPKNEHAIHTLNRRKLLELDNSRNSLEIKSYLRSSLKQFAYKTAETYSVLKESFYNRNEHSDFQNNNSLNGIGSLQSFDNGYSSSLTTLPLNNNSIFQEECYHNINNNYITSTYSEIMSRSRDFTRSKSAANVLSDSETEDGSLQDKVRKRRSNRAVSSKLRSTVENTESLVSNSSNHISKSLNSANHADCKLVDSTYISSNYHTPSSSVVYNNNFKYNSGSDNSYSPSSISPVIDISSVQYTPVDRFRWFLWRNIYLKIIKCVNFDVWLLSRLHNYRRFIILFLLLPLLIYLLYGALLDESRNNSLADLSSNVIAFPSYIYSIISSPFFHNKDISSSSEEESSCSTKFSDVLYYVLLSIAQFFTNCFTSLGNMFSQKSKPTKPDAVILTKSVSDKVDLNSITIKIIEERLNDVMKNQESQRSHSVQSPKEDSLIKIQNDITKLRQEFQTLVETVQKLEKDLTLKSSGTSVKYGNMIEENNGRITSINTKMEEFEGKLSTLNIAVKSCCDEKWTIADFASSFEKHFLKALKNIVDGGKDQNSPYYFYHEWLHSKMEVNKDSLAKELKLEFEKLGATGNKYDENIQKVVENVVHKHVETLKKTSNTFSHVGISSEDIDMSLVQKLIKEAIMLYDADKTGQVDYALESGGGSVLSTRCSESYAEKDGTISVLGFPLWSTHNSPRTAIQPDMQPGQCWAFKGSRGFLVIQLSYTIFPTGFTLEHIPVSLSPSGSIDSAPKEFSVWGLTSEKDNDGKSLGNYTYDQEGEPLQYFPVQNSYEEPFSYVELRINSNHGNLDYTCLYRFRVHGKQPKD